MCTSFYSYQSLSIREGAQPGGHNGREDPELGGILQLCEGDVVEVSGESWGDGVTSSARGTHGSDKCNVHQLTEGT